METLSCHYYSIFLSCPSTQTWKEQTSTNSLFVFLTRRHDRLEVLKFNKLATSPQGLLQAKGWWNTLEHRLTVSAAGEMDILLQSKEKVSGRWEEEVLRWLPCCPLPSYKYDP